MHGQDRENNSFIVIGLVRWTSLGLLIGLFWAAVGCFSTLDLPLLNLTAQTQNSVLFLEM